MTDGHGAQDDAFLLAAGTARELERQRRTDLVRLQDGRIGYASRTLFRPVGDDDRLEQIGVVTGDARGTSVLSLVFADGEVRETVGEAAAVVSKRLRADGYVVSSQPLPPAAPPPPEQDVEDGAVLGREAQSPAPTAGRLGQAPERAASYGRQALALLRLAVLLVGGVVVAILVLDVLLLLADANQKNDLVTFFRHASKPLAWKFKDLFEPRTRKANITENYLLAAVVYLVVTLGLARVLARLRGAIPVLHP